MQHCCCIVPHLRAALTLLCFKRLCVCVCVHVSLKAGGVAVWPPGSSFGTHTCRPQLRPPRPPLLIGTVCFPLLHKARQCSRSALTPQWRAEKVLEDLSPPLPLPFFPPLTSVLGGEGGEDKLAREKNDQLERHVLSPPIQLSNPSCHPFLSFVWQLQVPVCLPLPRTQSQVGRAKRAQA